MTTISDSAEVNDRVRIEARLTSLEAERPHLATKADVNALEAKMDTFEAKMERQTRLIIMWIVGTFLAVMIPLALAGFELLRQILERLPPATWECARKATLVL